VWNKNIVYLVNRFIVYEYIQGRMFEKAFYRNVKTNHHLSLKYSIFGVNTLGPQYKFRNLPPMVILVIIIIIENA